jgi:hypothetical protein
VSAAVSDQGESYQVDVEGRTKIYADPAHNCRERARVSAAFIALALAPETALPGSTEPVASAAGPSASSDRPPRPPASGSSDHAPPVPSASAAPPPVTRPPTKSRPFTPPWGRFDLRGAFEDSPELGIVGGGAMVRASFGWDAVGAHVLCGWLVSDAASIPLRTGSVSFERVPCALGATLRWVAAQHRLEASLDAGVALGSLHAVGHDFSTNTAGTALEIGARIGVDLALHLGSRRTGLAPVVGVEAEYVPTPDHLSVSGVSREGPVADSPRVWLGFTAGLCWTVQ